MSNPAVSFPGRACRFHPFADAVPLPALPEKKILLLPIGNAVIFFAFFARLKSRRPRFLYRIKIGVAVLAVILRACSVMKFMRFDVAVIPADSRGKRLRQRKKKRKAQRGGTQQRGMPPQNKRHSHSCSIGRRPVSPDHDADRDCFSASCSACETRAAHNGRTPSQS